MAAPRLGFAQLGGLARSMRGKRGTGTAFTKQDDLASITIEAAHNGETMWLQVDGEALGQVRAATFTHHAAQLRVVTPI